MNAARLLLENTPAVIALIVVNAGTRPRSLMNLNSKVPSAAAVMSAVSRTGLQRYNVESLTLMHRKLGEWAAELSTEGHTVTPYFITLDFESIADPQSRSVFNNMATSFSLPAEEVDALKAAGRHLLRQSPEFQRLLDSGGIRQAGTQTGEQTALTTAFAIASSNSHWHPARQDRFHVPKEPRHCLRKSCR